MEWEQVPDRRSGAGGQGQGQLEDLFCRRRFPMRDVFFSTLSNVVEFGIFAAAAGALAVGMMHVR